MSLAFFHGIGLQMFAEIDCVFTRLAQFRR